LSDDLGLTEGDLPHQCLLYSTSQQDARGITNQEYDARRRLPSLSHRPTDRRSRGASDAGFDEIGAMDAFFDDNVGVIFESLFLSPPEVARKVVVRTSCGFLPLALAATWTQSASVCGSTSL